MRVLCSDVRQRRKNWVNRARANLRPPTGQKFPKRHIAKNRAQLLLEMHVLPMIRSIRFDSYHTKQRYLFAQLTLAMHSDLELSIKDMDEHIYAMLFSNTPPRLVVVEPPRRNRKQTRTMTATNPSLIGKLNPSSS